MNSPAVLLLTALAAAVVALTWLGLARLALIRDEEPPATTVPVTLDTAALEAAFARLSANTTEALSALGKALNPAFAALGVLGQGLVRALSPVVRANDVVHVAGLEGRYFVRGGMSPACSSPAGRDALVLAVLAGTAEGCVLLTPDNRATVAAALVAGWVSSYDGEAPDVLAWHRALGDTHVEVGRAR